MRPTISVFVEIFQQKHVFSTWNGLTNCWSHVYKMINLVWTSFSDLKNSANSRPSNFKSLSRSLRQFFPKVGQNKFGKKIPISVFYLKKSWEPLNLLWDDVSRYSKLMIFKRWALFYTALSVHKLLGWFFKILYFMWMALLNVLPRFLANSFLGFN